METYCLAQFTIPRMPKSSTILYAKKNLLTALPTLPQSLTSLSVSINRLTALPTLPQSLKALSASNNQLTEFPMLPQSLTNRGAWLAQQVVERIANPSNQWLMTKVNSATLVAATPDCAWDMFNSCH